MVEEIRSDEELVQAYLSGENTAFDRLVERYQPRLMPFAHNILEHYQDAENAVQEMWLGAWQNIRTYEPTRKFSSWLYNICRKKCYDILREKYRRLEVPLPEDIERLRPGPRREWAEAKETRDRILAVLSHPDRRLYHLVMVEGQPFEAIPQIDPDLFLDKTVEELRDQFDRVLGIVLDRADKEKEKWRGVKRVEGEE